MEEFAGADGHLRFAMTEAFLQRFGLASLQELTAASVSANPSPIQIFDMSDCLIMEAPPPCRSFLGIVGRSMPTLRIPASSR